MCGGGGGGVGEEVGELWKGKWEGGFCLHISHSGYWKQADAVHQE